MSKGENSDQKTDKPAENREKVRKIAIEIIEPALQEALGAARGCCAAVGDIILASHCAA